MRIGVFGATGVIGSAVATEADRRGHQITRLTRSSAKVPTDVSDPTWRVVDPQDSAAVATAIDDLEVVVSAINSGETIHDQIARASILPAVTRVLLGALESRPDTRLIMVGGAGSLELRPGVRLIDDDDAVTVTLSALGLPQDYRRVMLAHAEALDLCRLSNRAWTYLSPSAGLITSGARTGRYRLGGDQLLAGADEAGDISAEDLAVALLDEIERPRHIQRRFTVGY